MATTISRHGATWETVPTSIQVPIRSAPGINVVVGAAPLYKFADGAARVGKLVLANTYAEAAAQLGFTKDFHNYPLCEHMYSAFRLYGVSPVCYIPIGPDPAVDRTPVPPTPLTLINGRVSLDRKDYIRDETLIVRDPAGADYVLGTDYVFDEDIDNEDLIVVRLAGGAIPTPNSPIEFEGFRLATGTITAARIIGGVNAVTGRATGIAAIEDVFGLFGLIPGILLTPGWSQLPEIFAVAVAACSDVNGCFKARFAADVDVWNGTNRNPLDVPAWKVANNMIHERADLLYLKLKLGSDYFWYSSHWGPLQQLVDATVGGNVPYVSASNKRLQMDSAVVMLPEIGPPGARIVYEEVILSKGTAEYLNVQAGVTVPLRWGTFGWRSFGNGTSLVPNTGDVVNMFSAVRRTFDYVGNTLVLTSHAVWLDSPGNRRSIDSLVNSSNAWGSSLHSQGAVLSFRVEFRHDENETVDLLSGQFKFHVWIGGVVPMQWIHFRLEYDVSGLETLFDTAAAA